MPGLSWLACRTVSALLINIIHSRFIFLLKIIIKLGGFATHRVRQRGRERTFKSVIKIPDLSFFASFLFCRGFFIGTKLVQFAEIKLWLPHRVVRIYRTIRFRGDEIIPLDGPGINYWSAYVAHWTTRPDQPLWNALIVIPGLVGGLGLHRITELTQINIGIGNGMK